MIAITIANTKKAAVKLLLNGGVRWEIWTSDLGVINPTYFPCKSLIATGLTSDVTWLVTPPLTIFRCDKCYNYSLKLTDISSDFKDTNITRITKSGNFLIPEKKSGW